MSNFSELLQRVDLGVRGRLGESIVYTPTVGSPITVEGVFDNAYVRALSANEPGVMSSGPAVFLRLEDLPSDPMADTGAIITRGTTTYTAHEVKPDGFGGVLLLLSEAD